MAGIIADMSEDIKKLQQVKAEIAGVKKELKSIDIRVNLDIKENFEARLKSLMEQYDTLVQKIAKVEGEMMIAKQKVSEAINGISSDPLISFDAELMKMCNNLNKYFDELLAKVESMSSLLQVGKAGIDGSTSNNVPIQQLEDLRIKNTELTEQLRVQKEEIRQQQEEWNKLAMAIKTNNVSAIEQYKQATNSSSDAVKSAKTELKGLTKDLNENIKYYDTLAAQIASYKSILDRLYTAQEKGMTRVPIGDGATALISSELERFKPLLDGVSQKSKEIALQISEQRKRQAELNTVIEQGNEKHARTRALILDAREQLVQMRSAGLQNTAQYQQVGQEVAKMRTQMTLVNAEMEYLSNPNKNLLVLKTGLQGIAGSASLVVGIMGFFNQKSEEMVQIQTKIQSLLGIIVGLETTYNTVKKTGILMRAVEDLQTKALIASQALEAKAKSQLIALTWPEVVAQKALNAVAKVNPYILLGTAILTLVGGMALLIKANKEGAKAQEEINRKVEAAKAMQESYMQSFASTASTQMTTYQKLKKEYELLGSSLKDKQKFILENKDSFRLLGLAVNGVSDAENIFINQSDAVTNAIMQRAKAAAIGKIAQEKWEQYFKERENNITLQSGISAISSNIEYENGIPIRKLSFDKNKADETRQLLENSIDEDATIKALKDEAEKWSELQIGVEKEINDILKKAGIDVYDNNASKQESAAEKLRKEQEKYKVLLDKQALEQQRSAEDLQMKVDEARIKAMDEGSAKTIAEMELNFEKEMQTIDRQKEDALRKKIEDARTAWDANPENKGKSFDGSGITLSKDENTPFNELYKGGIAAFEKNLKEYQDKQDDAWNEYYIKYGEYQEKRKAIMDKYDKQIADAEEGSVEKSTFIAQRKEDLDSLDDELMKDSELWSKFFTDFSNRSSSSIRSIIEDIQELVDYMNGVEGAKIPDLFKDNEKTVKAINDAMSDPSSLNKFTSNLSSQVNKFKKMLDKDNPFKQIQEGFKNNDFESTSKGFSGIASAVRELDGVLGDLGVKSDSTAGKVTSVLSSTASYAATGASVGGPWGAVIGGAIGMASGLIGILGADYSAYNKMKEEYGALIDVWDTLISKKQKYIDISYGDEARKAGQEVLDLLNKKAQSNVALGVERLNAGASAGSHSIGVRQRKGMSSQGWDELRKAAQSIGFDYNSVADGRMTGLFSLTAEQLERLQEEAPTFWAKLDSDVQGYLQNIIDCSDEIEDMKTKLQETMTGVSFDSFYDSFVSTLSDMNKSSKDMADDFGEYLKNAILENLVANKYRAKIEALYNDWAAKSDSDGDGVFDLTVKESAELKASQKALAEQIMAERDAMADAFGWSSDISTSQDSSSRGFQTMSQDTGEELNGRFTALQIAGEEIKNQSIAQTGLLSSINEKMSLLDLTNEDIPRLMANVPDIAGQTRESIASGYQSQVNIVFPDEKIDVLTLEVSALRGIVNEMRILQVEGNLDRQEIREGIQVVSKNSPRMISEIVEVKKNTSKL
ncbi:phage tail tape measure protein [Bacteroides cellulosilyticus]|uniref:phage tail tape measure protein n=1 Tax=Bacteroides cellulosilyticus TaxID=246787 RepID=UPI0032ED5E72